MDKSLTYKKCAAIVKPEPDYTTDAKVIEKISTGFRVLPTFEKSLFDQVFTKYYSLQRNELLKCRWRQYVNSLEGRIYAPFQFPDIRDLHFHNGAVRMKPEACTHRAEHRMKMAHGPGFDSRGHLPIPQEAMMKRGTIENVKKPKKYPKKTE